VDGRREDARLRALRAYRVLDTPTEAAYDTLVRLAASVCGTPIALISLIDESRLWFKASYGLDGVAETPRESAFCDHAIRGREVFEVADARADDRFAANPLVVADPPVRFYAGAPLVTPDGDAIGTICVLDREPRALTGLQHEQLTLLARLVMDELERRKELRRLADGLAQAAAQSERRRLELHEARATQADLVARLARDVRGPVTSIVGFARLLEEDGRFPADAREALAVVRASGERVGEIASDIDLLSRIELAAVEPQWQTVDLAALADAAGALIEPRSGVRIVADPDLLTTVLGRLVEDGSRPLAPVRARVEDLGEAVALELSGTGASPAGDGSVPTIGGRLASRIVERHGGSYRAGGSEGAWWIRLTLPADPRRAERRLRVVLVGPPGAGEAPSDQLRALGFLVETAGDASEVRGARAAVDVAVFAAGRGAWAQREHLAPELRRRIGLVALSSAEQRAGDGWDAAVPAPAQPSDLGAAVYAAAAKARKRRAEDGLVASST
jgi:GAF domain-containing protein